MGKNIENAGMRYLSPCQAAERFMVSPVTLRHWALAGKLAFITTPGGHRRFALEEVERFAAKFLQEKGGRMPACELSGQRILVVDDDRLITEYLVELFTGLPGPRHCEVAHDGFEAGRKVAEFSPHVVLLDLMMPDINGFQVCQSIKLASKTRDTRVIMMTGYHTPAHVEQALDAGAEACLAKPLDKLLLMKTLGLDENVS
ncbi:MAG: response regulator [Gammaproteobacteria bacterium]|nr:response regulator [Gammaproteobacteria bacterium]